MISPARQRRLARIAKQAQESAFKGEAQAGYGKGPNQQQEILLTALAEDLRALSQIQSHEGKAAHKAAHMGKYLPWVDGLLQAGNEGKGGAPDEVFANLFVWSYDVGNYRRMLDMARHMTRYQMPMPEQFKQGAASFAIKGISEDALAGKMTDEQAIALLDEAAALIEGADIHEKRLALLYKAKGHALIHRLGNAPLDENKLALEPASMAYIFLNHALDLDTSSGVKKDIERLTTFIKKNNPERLEQLLKRVQSRRQGTECPAPGGACDQGADHQQTTEAASTPPSDSSDSSDSPHEGEQQA